MRDDAVTVIVCGSSAALSIHGHLSRLRRALGAEAAVRVVLTRDAERFLRPEVVGWYADEAFTHDSPGFNPTECALRSRAIVVLPATANMLAATATGLAATPAQTTILAADQPVLFFPSMNRVMWDKPVIRRHVATMRSDGHTVVDPVEGEAYEIWRRRIVPTLVLAEPDRVVKVVASWCADRPGRDAP